MTILGEMFNFQKKSTQYEITKLLCGLYFKTITIIIIDDTSQG